MNIQEQLMHTTVRIEIIKNNSVIGLGTGFFVSVPVSEENYKIVLISNKHVLFAADDIAITFTTLKNGEPNYGSIMRIPIGKISNNVIGHPDPKIDVAALVCTGIFNLFPDILFFKAISIDMLSDFKESELSVAENVFFVGYPDGRYDSKNNLPLIRTGLIASDPKMDYNGLPEFVIDAQVFPGSSGSPVYINFTYEDMKNGNFIIGGKQNIKVLGIVAQTMIRNNVLQSVETAAMNYTEEVLGLGIVYKSTVIRETIELALASV